MRQTLRRFESAHAIVKQRAQLSTKPSLVIRAALASRAADTQENRVSDR